MTLAAEGAICTVMVEVELLLLPQPTAASASMNSARYPQRLIPFLPRRLNWRLPRVPVGRISLLPKLDESAK